MDDGKKSARYPVHLNVYDLTDTSSVLGELSRRLTSGTFHVGIEVHASEFSYGATAEPVTGVAETVPKTYMDFPLRETLYLGTTEKDLSSIRAFLDAASPNWMGQDYHIFRKNCAHFADALGEFLASVQRVPQEYRDLPDKVQRAAERFERIGAALGFPNAAARLEQRLMVYGKEHAPISSKSSAPLPPPRTAEEM